MSLEIGIVILQPCCDVVLEIGAVFNKKVTRSCQILLDEMTPMPQLLCREITKSAILCPLTWLERGRPGVAADMVFAEEELVAVYETVVLSVGLIEHCSTIAWEHSTVQQSQQPAATLCEGLAVWKCRKPFGMSIKSGLVVRGIILVAEFLKEQFVRTYPINEGARHLVIPLHILLLVSRLASTGSNE